jgi:hypothetical protein
LIDHILYLRLPGSAGSALLPFIVPRAFLLQARPFYDMRPLGSTEPVALLPQAGRGLIRGRPILLKVVERHGIEDDMVVDMSAVLSRGYFNFFSKRLEIATIGSKKHLTSDITNVIMSFNKRRHPNLQAFTPKEVKSDLYPLLALYPNALPRAIRIQT